jgi:acetyl-CoA C-acetyltransferase
LTTLTRERRRRGARDGLGAMCIGGGQGLAAVVESLA